MAANFSAKAAIILFMSIGLPEKVPQYLGIVKSMNSLLERYAVIFKSLNLKTANNRLGDR